jgi:adenine-specific DNA methylase
MPWLMEGIQNHLQPGQRILDAYTGSGLVTYALTSKGYELSASDQLLSSLMTVQAMSGESRDLEPSELSDALAYATAKESGTELSSIFEGIFFPQEELIWLDRMSQFIQNLPTEARPRAFWALFQSALAKRPYNLFHRANLEMRTRDVSRSFGNKATWEKPFPNHFAKFLAEASTHALNSSKVETFHGDPLNINETNFDMIYLDPPYINEKGQATPYIDYYGFLDLLIDPQLIGRVNQDKANKPIEPLEGGWNNPSAALETLEKLMLKFPSSSIALSYRSDGQPSMETLSELMNSHRSKIKVYMKPLKYALSSKADAEEILIVAE